ncbi:MAG: hypothetical protein AAGA61_06040 [Pseudomonadota bacterium]
MIRTTVIHGRSLGPAPPRAWLLDAAGVHGDTRFMTTVLQDRWNWWLPSQEWAAR